MSTPEEIILNLKEMRGWLIANFFASEKEGYLWVHILDHVISDYEKTQGLKL